MESEDRQENSESEMGRNENSSEETQPRSRLAKLRDLLPEKDPMGAGRPAAPESTR